MSAAAPAPTRRWGGKLTRDGVLAAALELVAEHGIDGLSMRRLADQLSCTSMALYRSAANKSALLYGTRHREQRS